MKTYLMLRFLFISIPGVSEWIIILVTLFWIVAVIDVATSKFIKPGSKITWLLITILLGIFGALLYWTIGRRYRISKNDFN